MALSRAPLEVPSRPVPSELPSLRLCIVFLCGSPTFVSLKLPLLHSFLSTPCSGPALQRDPGIRQCSSVLESFIAVTVSVGCPCVSGSRRSFRGAKLMLDGPCLSQLSQLHTCAQSRQTACRRYLCHHDGSTLRCASFSCDPPLFTFIFLPLLCRANVCLLSSGLFPISTANVLNRIDAPQHVFNWSWSREASFRRPLTLPSL